MFAPTIKTIPSFIDTLKVYYTTIEDVEKLYLKVRTVDTGVIINTEDIVALTIASPAIFNLKELNPNTYYNFQISTDNKTWSNMFMSKCIEDITITLKDTLTQSVTELSSGSYEAIVAGGEQLYRYSFSLKDEDGVEIEKTGWQDWVKDQPIRFSQRSDKNGFLDFTIETINGYVETASAAVIKKSTFSTQIDGEVTVAADVSNGSVVIEGELKTDNSFELLRKKVNGYWESICLFTTSFYWRDWTIENGEQYIYGIRNNFNGIVSSILELNGGVPIQVYFEDTFLSDGQKQLKIAFNTSVSSFKSTILETKTDTIGGAYPYFFKNGNKKYKEFPINGLISYWMDEDNLFMPALLNEKFVTFNQTDENIKAERDFKLAVLEWLSNGKPKLYRSAQEGNYAIRLMNVSLAPQGNLNRMLHTFSATAYECADSSLSSLIQNDLIKSIVEKEKVDRAYLTTTAANGELITLENVFNLTITVDPPSVEQVLNLGDGNMMALTQNVTTTPKGVVYSNVSLATLPNQTAAIMYNQAGPYYTTKDILETIPAGSTFKGNNLETIYSLTLEPINNTDLVATIGDTLIILEDNEIRTYKNLDPVSFISLGTGVQATIHYSIKKEVN